MAKGSTKAAKDGNTVKVQDQSDTKGSDGVSATHNSGAGKSTGKAGGGAIALLPSDTKKDDNGSSEVHEWPACNTELREVRLLVASANNARTHSASQIDDLVELIQRFGWTQPILIDAKGGIIAGHGRVMAARRLGLARVPVIVAHGWTELQRRAYMLADNQVPLNAGWDLKLLASELQELGAEGYELPALGFDQDFISGMLGGYAATAAVNEADVLNAMANPERITSSVSTQSAGAGVAINATVPHHQPAAPPTGQAYQPVLDPSRSTTGVTSSDVARAEQQMAQRPNDQARSDLVEVICPHCGESYDIDRKSLA